jgi:hypothetical protein
VDHSDLAFAQALEEDSGWAQLICDGFTELVKGFWDSEYVALIMDRWGGSITFGDVYCFLNMHALLASGKALRTTIKLGGEPHSDRFAAENNELLTRLPFPFSGRFLGGQGDNDGSIEWSRPIEADGILDGGERRVATIPAGQAPLEVGYTNAFTTLFHLKESWNVARWPYGSTRITIIHLIEPGTFELP